MLLHRIYEHGTFIQTVQVQNTEDILCSSDIYIDYWHTAVDGLRLILLSQFCGREDNVPAGKITGYHS